MLYSEKNQMGTVLPLSTKQKLSNQLWMNPFVHTPTYGYACICMWLVHRYLCLENVVEEVHERVGWGFLIHLVEIWKNRYIFIILVT